MDPVSAFGVASGALQCADEAAKLVSSIFGYLRAVKNAPKHSERLLEEVRLLHTALQQLESTLKVIAIPSIPETTDETLKKFIEDMKIMGKQMKINDGDTMKRLEWPFTKKQNEEYLSRLQRYINAFNMIFSTIQARG
jgi:hypothetical protein